MRAAASDARPRSVGALAFALTLLACVCLYAALRIGQVALFREPDPTEALFNVHSGYFWRIWTAIYGAGLLAPLFYWLCARRAEVASRLFGALVFGTAALIVAQALFFP